MRRALQQEARTYAHTSVWYCFDPSPYEPHTACRLVGARRVRRVEVDGQGGRHLVDAGLADPRMLAEEILEASGFFTISRAKSSSYSDSRFTFVIRLCRCSRRMRLLSATFWLRPGNMETSIPNSFAPRFANAMARMMS